MLMHHKGLFNTLELFLEASYPALYSIQIPQVTAGKHKLNTNVTETHVTVGHRPTAWTHAGNSLSCSCTVGKLCLVLISCMCYLSIKTEFIQAHSQGL